MARQQDSANTGSVRQARVGVDIGGTFTDVALALEDRLVTAKVLTTHGAPEEAILQALAQVLTEAGIAASDLLQMIHGTTLATNALLERRGARTAFVTSLGFRDVIEMRAENRFELYDLDLELPEPLISREHRFVVGGRLAADGAELAAFDADGMRALAAQILDGGYESVAIGFIHAYANPAHERRARAMLLELCPDVSVSISSEVAPQMRELERFNTVCANAYVKPAISAYLARLDARLKALGMRCPVAMMHSGGGLMALRTAAEFPVRLLESGPAGGAIFAAEIARAHGLDRVISFDMGGTTAKICLIENGKPALARRFEAARSYRFKKGSGIGLAIPVVEMVEIGAGGGSIAGVDSLGRIQVGPESAGSEPGPACYGRGGARPAVTDADLLIGRLDAAGFAGGSFPLDRAAAEAVMIKSVAYPLGLDADAAAMGVIETVDEAMAAAARAHAVESGVDLSGYAMIAFGGAAPLHAARVAAKLGVETVLSPRGAGVGSAIGFLFAPFAFEAVRGAFLSLGETGAGAAADARIAEIFAELEAEARAFVAEGAPDAETSVERTVFLRYRGQGHEIPIAMSGLMLATNAGDSLRAAFEAEYERLFGQTLDGLAVEAVSWSARVVAERAPAGFVGSSAASAAGGAAAPPESGARTMYDPEVGDFVEARVVARSALAVGHRVTGPAIVTEDETTTVVPSGYALESRADGVLWMSRGDASAATRRAPGVFDRQIMWRRLIAVVEEQAQTLVRTAFSTSVREAGDLSAGVFDAEGRMLAQAVTGTPGHVNAMAAAVANFIVDIGPQNILDGDVYVTNDPWKGTGHLHDFTFVTPVFRGGERVAFFASTAHVVDVGGRGFGPDGRDVYEEGIYVPILKFSDAGRLNRDLLSIVRHNVREADQVIGDLHSLAACNEIGRRRLLAMMDEFALADLTGLAGEIFERSRAATLAALGSFGAGQASHRMTVDGYGDPVTIAVRLTLGAEGAHVDFEGTSPESPRGVNVPLIYTAAYAGYALRCAFAPDIPNNHASLAPFTVSAPPGSILNAQPPAPVAIRHVLGHFVPDAVLGAAHALRPGGAPAESAGALWNLQASLTPLPGVDGGRRAEILMFNSGGSGARPTRDGLNATAFPSGVMAQSVEATEQTGPLVIWRKELRDGSGGEGAWRGGLGQIMEIGPAPGHRLDVNAMFDRCDHPALGREGGGPGGAGSVRLDTGEPLSPKGRQAIPAGRRIVLELPGGGGYGVAANRDPALIARDRKRGFL